jgi:hypothetical protein
MGDYIGSSDVIDLHHSASRTHEHKAKKDKNTHTKTHQTPQEIHTKNDQLVDGRRKTGDGKATDRLLLQPTREYMYLGSTSPDEAANGQRPPLSMRNAAAKRRQ